MRGNTNLGYGRPHNSGESCGERWKHTIHAGGQIGIRIRCSACACQSLWKPSPFSFQSMRYQRLRVRDLRVRLLRLTVCRPLHPCAHYEHIYRNSAVLPGMALYHRYANSVPTIRSAFLACHAGVCLLFVHGHSPRALVRYWSRDWQWLRDLTCALHVPA